jgi:hypothetical protein
MRLAQPFFRLPLRFDARRLEEEVRALPERAWNRHPTEYEGNSSVRLISVDGGENDGVGGHMRATPHLQASPYLQQVLGSFGVVWSRSRLMRLAPGQGVPEHADINYHWFSRVRVHIPVVTRPEVRFHCGDASVHMAAGESWIFDNWRRHRVENPSDHERIHLVADTTGSAAFWRLVGTAARTEPMAVPFTPDKPALVLTEQNEGPWVLPPAEIDLLVGDLAGELELDPARPDAAGRMEALRLLLHDLCREWRQLWLLTDDPAEGRPRFAQLIERTRHNAAVLADGFVMRTNRVPAAQVLEARVLRYALRDDAAPARRSRVRFERPVFIVAAPRSGSTLLFETLACSPQLATLGGEAHWLVEGIEPLRPGAPGVDSNRLTAAHATDAIGQALVHAAGERLVDAGGAAVRDGAAARLLEKTPKNALRIPFFDRIFPDARFVFLWRDPRENLASIMEGWRGDRWITYPRLDGWEGPWSFLLPPGWRELRGRPLEEIAAHQWDSANRIALDDLAALDPQRWCALDYAALIAQPEAAIRRICAFAGIPFDAALARRVAQPLPLSRYTQTPPAPDKWRRHEAAILRVLPRVTPTWDRLRRLQPPNV